MRKTAWLSAMLLAFSLFATTAVAAEQMDHQTKQKLGAINSALDELRFQGADSVPEQRAGRGDRLNQAFVALTGEAVNPLFGVTALGMWRYFSTPEHLRESLPLYDQPTIWAPLLAIILLMLFNSTICEAIPPLKVPLNALGDIVNKAGAVAVLPIVIKMFADHFAPSAGNEFAALWNTAFPAAYAAEGAGAASGLWLNLGWLAGAIVGAFIYAAVWLTFNVIDVLILICPFPGVDAVLKSFRLSIMGILTGAHHLSPSTAVALAAVIVLVSLCLAGWSFRLSVFGFIFSTDILFFRKKELDGAGSNGFSCAGLKHSHKIPMRTWGQLRKTEEGKLAFSYRPWLVLGRREVEIGTANDFSAGRGLLNPFLVADADPDTPWLRLPPRYRWNEEMMAGVFGLRRTVDCGVSGKFRTWLGQLFNPKKPVEAAA